NAVILEDLTSTTLARIFKEPAQGVLQTSQNFFQKYNIQLEITDDAVQKIADEASKSSRIRARALKSVYGWSIKPFECDTFSREEVKPLNGEGGPFRLVIDDKRVSEALKPAV